MTTRRRSLASGLFSLGVMIVDGSRKVVVVLLVLVGLANIGYAVYGATRGGELALGGVVAGVVAIAMALLVVRTSKIDD